MYATNKASAQVAVHFKHKLLILVLVRVASKSELHQANLRFRPLIFEFQTLESQKQAKTRERAWFLCSWVLYRGGMGHGLFHGGDEEPGFPVACLGG